MMVTTQSTSENLSQRNRPRSSAEAPLRALVVDDEPVARRVVIFALTHEGFVCDAAVDGLDALEKIRRSSYDLVVTDLLMPHKHGHALSVELLERRRDGTPLIVVHTSIDNPRLTKDLIMRGVDDVVYKPAHYEAFAAKMRAMVNRRRWETSRACAAVESEAPRAGPSVSPSVTTASNSLQPLVWRNSSNG
ncbi:MAG: hypothetical protein KatS3mg109_1366 [Pirellulaceae bacterium]|nr:MAG: hypothetical protein KatS3mg109_1366 [Pirellulaceae bacterium]